MRRFFFSLSLLFVFLLAAPVCQAKTGVLLAAFGSSLPEARKAYAAIEKAYARAFPASPLVWTYTSQKIRKKLRKQGEATYGIAEGLDKLAAEGADKVIIQSLHMTAGAEFAALARAALIYVVRHPGKFKAVYLGRPLLESDADAREVAKSALADLKNFRESGEAVVFMAHGNDTGRSDLTLQGAGAILGRNDNLAFLAGVEGSLNIDDVIEKLKQLKIRKVCLAPLMVVAGDHAVNDMAGDEDSWASRLRAAGFEVRVSLKGLGEIPAIADLFLKHSSAATDDLALEPIKP
ncbi:MAG: sirohydrochlorin cobaltochelatase [Desulfovibrio sp.]|nr:sirohydrochlorin cobaltochelatase [Desulfovibrio sp.]